MPLLGLSNQVWPDFGFHQQAQTRFEMVQKPINRRRAVPGLPSLNVSWLAYGFEQCSPFFVSSSRAMREQQAKGRVLSAQGLQQNGGSAGFAQGHSMNPDQFRAIFTRLVVITKSLFYRIKITRLLLPTALQLAAQHGLAHGHQC